MKSAKKYYYYLYKITNEINGKIYIGVHKTSNLDDGYMGSGIKLKNAIKKYGLENFKKVILETFEDQKSMYEREKEIVTKDFISRKDVYNYKCGGEGGFDHINNQKDLSYISIRSANGRNHNCKTRGLRSFSERYGKDNYFFGIKMPSNFANSPELQKNATEKSLSSSAREKRKATMALKGHSKGEKNSQFGTMWINDGVNNSKIKKDAEIPHGWNKGRITVNKKDSI